MKRLKVITACMFAFAAAVTAAAEPPAAGLSWKQTDSTLALMGGDKVVWQFTYAKGEAKPYFHPITVAGGPSLTDLRPADHPWHLGLWLSWKYLNGLNYWEQDRKTGKAQGITEVLGANAVARDDHSARFELKLAYHPPEQRPLLTEDRTIAVAAPTADGALQIDWLSTFRAGDADVKMDRTPILGQPDGKPYGGYAGLSLRLAPALRDWHFADVEGAQSGSSAQSRWMSFSGKLGEQQTATILVLDHPQSFRHPTWWYLINRMPYFSPAVLYREPYTLPAGQSITLKYRLLFQPGALDAAAAQQQWERFAAEKQ